MPGPARLGGAGVNAIFRWCGFRFSWARGGERARQDQYGHEGLLVESRTRIWEPSAVKAAVKRRVAGADAPLLDQGAS